MNKNHLAVPAAVLSAALAFPAEAAASSTHPTLTKHEQRLNQLSQNDIRTLVHRIIEGPVGRDGSEDEVLPTSGGGKIDLRTVTVDAPNLIGTGNGRYSFQVLAPLTAQGTLNERKVEAVVLSEGEATDPAYSLNPYVTLAYVKNQQTGTWAVRGDYQERKGPGTVTIEASVLPEEQKEAQLTNKELRLFTEQANDMVDNALVDMAVGSYEPAFNQPAGTVINPLK